MDKENLFKFTLWSFAMIIIVGTIVVLFQDHEYVENKHQENFERVDTITVVDIHGNIIIIEENGKYTRFWRKNID
jgi:hypothetical protein